MRAYLLTHTPLNNQGTNEQLTNRATTLFLEKGDKTKQYYADTNAKHFLSSTAAPSEQEAFLNRPGSQFDPAKTDSLENLLGQLYAKDPGHLMHGDDREQFIAEGADPNSFLPFCRYIKAEGYGGYVGSMKTEDLDDDTPLTFHEKSPGSNIISFVVEQPEKPYKNYSTIILGPPDNDENKDADHARHGKFWTAFPGAASRQDPERKNRSKEEQAAHDQWVHETAKKLEAEDRLTVGNVRSVIKQGREFDCNVRVTPNS